MKSTYINRSQFERLAALGGALFFGYDYTRAFHDAEQGGKILLRYVASGYSFSLQWATAPVAVVRRLFSTRAHVR